MALLCNRHGDERLLHPVVVGREPRRSPAPRVEDTRTTRSVPAGDGRSRTGREVPRRPPGGGREERPPAGRISLPIRLRRTAAEAPRRTVLRIREVPTTKPPMKHQNQDESGEKNTAV